MSKRILNFSDEVDLKLQELKKELQMPINKIITMIINEKLEDLKILKKEYVEDFKSEDTKNEMQINFRISEKEKIFLEEQVKRTGNKSLTSEIRYRLLNSIYKNKYFLPIEVKEIRDFNFQIKMIGNNINQISTKLNSNKTLNNIDISILKNSIDELNIRMKETKDEIENILNFANKRF
ncbi:hypothetical protein N5T95_10205 [Aliarcobacter cryaerophilus]|uniref:hypothetical protein n=1 Tax=Aliarcobacter cryaerophilus TaxID=28198 RepID=UPI0021B5FC52|nr:hypothetical protein [Aliarcobacter cryaerophilus]MCT7535887.1 hypothetical protein [Aliarcobacter cryaerophilus]